MEKVLHHLPEVVPALFNSSAIPEEVANTFVPSLSLRPHHFWLIEVQEALSRSGDPLRCARNRIGWLEYVGNTGAQREYTIDLIGERTMQDKRGYMERLDGYYSKLRNLPDDSCIHLDLKPDGICDACVIGKHCIGTNYRSNLSAGSTVYAEIEKLLEICAHLVDRRYQIGKDFITRLTVHSLYDFQGRTLDNFSKSTPVDVLFDSLIVKTYALRDIARVF